MSEAPDLEAERALARARALFCRLHEPGVRDEHRALLEAAARHAKAALDAKDDAKGAPEDVATRARTLLLQAQAARAEDARYGAGQLSRGSQRAPTPADCDDGWRRVEAIVQTAEACAKDAVDLAEALGDRRSAGLAEGATRAARAARQIVVDRNHAYTFHANPSFSFGEGWYLGAAVLLGEVTFQVEPDQAQTHQVERFVEDAGLRAFARPYRSRPRANKHLTDIVARGFRAGPESAQSKLRSAFLGEDGLLAEVVEWAERGLSHAPPGPKVLLWVRYARHHPDRNTTQAELAALSSRAQRLGVTPILVGDALREGPPPEATVDWTLFWKQPVFQGEDMRRAQLHLFEHLQRAHQLIGQIGVTTAGMDGPALMGLPTMYITARSNVRMREWVGAVPGYEEIVRDDGYLERIDDGLRRWRG